VRRLPLLLALAAAALTVGAGPAAATNECRGLMVCVPVAGPWVVVPTGGGIPRPRVEYQLACPRGYIVGGTDAELSHRGIDLSFVALLGGPVTPGVTTSRETVFAAAYFGGGAPAPSFRPHIGCMPASGGGGIPTLASRRVLPPGKPAIRRVRDVDLAPGARRVVQGCAAGERLVDAAHAVGFYTDAPPAAAVVAGVSAVRRVAAGRVTVTVRARSLGARTVVQVAAVCAGGQ
jgi:hypothetical protein